MNSNHSPAPWRITKRGSLHIIHPNDGDREYAIRHEGNARLMASAPDLLAACQGFLDVLALLGPLQASPWFTEAQAARAAIAKAKSLT